SLAERVRAVLRIGVPVPDVGGAVVGVCRPFGIGSEYTISADAGAEPQLGILNVGEQQLLNVAGRSLFRSQVGVLGGRPGDPVLLAAPHQIRWTAKGAPGPRAAPHAAIGHMLIMVLKVHLQGEADLAEVRKARGLPRLVPRLRKNGKQDRSQYSDDS